MAAADGRDARDLAEEAFDAYMSAALDGAAEPPDEFLARYPDADDALRARVREMWAAAAPRRAVAAAPDDAPSIAGFRIVGTLGAGGMGVVYDAVQPGLGRRVALKVLRSDLGGSPEARARFAREAELLARLDHPGIVRVHAAGAEDGVRWIAMQLVDGRGLDALLREAPGGRLATPRVLRWGAQLARALAYAHAHGVVHRDVKPSNVLIDGDDRARLLDFGVARVETAGDAAMTRSFVGSPAYAAPEQLVGDAVDGRADVHALAATLYECLTGCAAFDGGSVDRVIHQVLHEAPLAPSRRAPALSRDVDLVLAKALQKDPARRYADATAFADDLDALLAFRTVSARPPTAGERLRDAARRRPAVTAALVTALLAAAAGAAVLAGHARTAERQRRADARSDVQAARERLDAFRARRAAGAQLDADVAWRRQELESRHVADERLAELDRAERELATLRRERETVYHEVLALLRRAERADPQVEGAAHVRAAVFAEKHAEALAQHDAEAAAFYADLVEGAEPGGTFAAQVRGTGTLAVTVDAPDAELHVFRYEDLATLVPGGAPRFVPVPLHGIPDGFEPGAAMWTVAADAGELREGDVVVERAGERGVVLRDGARLGVTLPPDAELRPTAAAVVPCAASRVGTAPLERCELPRGEYLLLVRAPGRVPVRALFRIAAGSGTQLALHAPAERVPGCVLVPAPVENEPARPFWIAAYEVTCAEYLEFLDDPATRAAIDASPTPVFAPRAPENQATGGYWPRDADGRFRIHPDWDPRWPVLGISYDDAVAYAAWRTRRAAARGEPWCYRLPTLGEALAAAGEPHRRYAFGETFRPRFAKSCFARAEASPEPVGSYPVDESPYGVLDMAGSAAEWCAGWYDEGRRLRRANFGSWAWSKAAAFEIWAANGWSPEAGLGVVGLRLVVEERTER